VPVSAHLPDLREAREQLVLAVEAAIRIVAHVLRVIELVRLDVFVNDSEARHEGFRIALVRFGKRRRICRK
jgi:hypothetical protein